MEKETIDFKNLGRFSKLLLKNRDYIQISTNERKIKNGKKPRILRVLCQRPYFTGSGINFVNLIRKTKKEGPDQFVIFGRPAGIENKLKDILNPEDTNPVIFKNTQYPELESDISFPVAGMSDKMPYKSTIFSSFDSKMLEEYLVAFARKIENAVQFFKPNILHTHHLWLITALSRVLNPRLPLIATCHNTALRQMKLSSHLKPFVIKPIQNVDYIAVNNEDQMRRVRKIYYFNQNGGKSNKFFFIGQGIESETFFPKKKVIKNKRSRTIKLIYTGKLAFSKGVLQLIEAFKQISQEIDEKIELYIVGSGIGTEKEIIMDSAKEFSEKIHFLGQLNQAELAEKFRESDLFILPSFYDGFPKVMLEALACGCKVIISDLPGVEENIKKIDGYSGNIYFIPLPRMKTIDQPIEEDLPKFIRNLKKMISSLLCDSNTQDFNLKFCNNIREKFGAEGLFKKYLEKYYTFQI